jgi:hypothetical protein
MTSTGSSDYRGMPPAGMAVLGFVRPRSNRAWPGLNAFWWP